MHGAENSSLEIVFLVERYDTPQSQISMSKHIKLHARTDNENCNLYGSALPYFFLVFLSRLPFSSSFLVFLSRLSFSSSFLVFLSRLPFSSSFLTSFRPVHPEARDVYRSSKLIPKRSAILWPIMWEVNIHVRRSLKSIECHQYFLTRG